MKQSFYTLVVIACSILMSCKTSEDVTKSDQNDSGLDGNTTTEMNNDSGSQSTADSLFASISRTPCFGTCPVYDMYIYEGGTVILEANRFIDLEGKFTTQITADQKQAFIDKANFIGFMDLEDKYDGPITDVPSATTTIRIDGIRKEVYRRANFPRKILDLEKLFDDLLESQDWEEISE